MVDALRDHGWDVVRAIDTRMTPGDLLGAFDELAARDEPFAPYPIVHLKPKR